MSSILLIVLLLFSSEYRAQSTASKQVSTFSMDAPQLDNDKTIWVYLPESYSTSQNFYPVIYMFDAQNLFDAETSYAGEWNIDEYLDTLTNKQVIIVAIEHGNTKRLEELTPYTNTEYGGGQGDLFMEFITHTVKPHIDVNYRTKPKAEDTSIFGASLGGLMALYATIKHPDTFSKAGIFSGAFWINQDIYKLVSSSEIPKTSKFFFLVGSKESDTMVPDQEKMISLLKENEVPDSNINYKIVDGGEHNETLWRENFPEAFQWLMN
ncbi:MAG: alpha/beta hydrolase-fold protein [Psychroserpens sp.]|uniref:alpha/beta hydrolase n=1 Tax=Psychroserpens sp. TaxID=2020870 RepID=UPI003C725A20